MTAPDAAAPRRVFLLGATGTIGRATLRALLARGHHVTCFVRRGGDGAARAALLKGATVREGDVTDAASLARDGFAGEAFDVLVSCMASRTGTPADAWAIDHHAHARALTAAKAAGVTQVVLLSAICVQKPQLAFQRAKLAFEQELAASGLTYSIVRATAYFKSLAGQVARVQQGRPYLMFGDGRLTACKPVSDADLGAYLADCITDASRWNRILPIGGPGPAITPLEQGERLFALTGRTPKYTRVPVAMLDVIIGVLGTLGKVFPPLADKAEFARIGRYYATESMLVWDERTGRYDAEGTPETGRDRLFDYYAALVRGDAVAERGDHAVF